MSTDRDTTRIVRSWLRTEENESADRVLGTVLDRLDTTPQRRATWWPARRLSTMNTTLKFGLAAVVVAVAVLIGINYLAEPSVGGPGPSEPTATPTSEPRPTPEPSVAEPSSAPEGLLPEGPFVFTTADGGTPITVTIPAPGWSPLTEFGVIVKNENSDPPDGAAVIGPFLDDLYVYGDPCQWSTTLPDTPATTVDDVVAALMAQASRDASAPVDIMVDGYSGKSITLHVPDDAATAGGEFVGCDEQNFASWAGGGEPVSAGPSRHHQGNGQIDEVWILDVDGQLVVMDAMYGAETPDEHLDELHAILESMTFEE